mmetsp:Transcript_4919/g.15447  ORF Transcript_4919/g.15447 Transcript_4919/m.15447 type:complete len:490 (-) Transcript_4919:856-2325(-)
MEPTSATSHWAASCVLEAQGETTPAQALNAAHSQPRPEYQYSQQQSASRYYYNPLPHQQHVQQPIQLMQQQHTIRRLQMSAGHLLSAPKLPLPPSLKVYAERSFAACTCETERSRMQQKLHALLISSIESNTLHSIDWNSAPIPDIAEGSRAEDVTLKPLASARRKCGLPDDELTQRDARAKRFMRFADASEANRGSVKRRKTTKSFSHVGSSSQESEWTRTSECVVGTCEQVEKDYFRLTSAPDPRDVRPERVLIVALSRLKQKWKRNEVDYDWACNQLKAIRQDLVVQGLTNKEFSLNVYETHARIALENGDMNEYNQCQSQLKELYSFADDAAFAFEFLAYRILYYVWLSTSTKEAATELLPILRDMPDEAWTDPAVNHALQVQQALQLGNYATFFRRYTDAPNMGAYILDLFVDDVRLDAAHRIVKAFRPTTTLPAVGLPFLDSNHVTAVCSSDDSWVFSARTPSRMPMPLSRESVFESPETRST